MSDSAKRIQASSRRRDLGATSADRQERNDVPPVWCAHAGRIRAPRRLETLLQFKGFAGGVPLNTERTTVKPWVGISMR